MSHKILIILAVFYFAAAESRGNISLGSPFGAHLIYHEVHEKYGIILMKRDEDVFVSGVGNELIQAIVVQDLGGEGISYVVSGGINRRNVTIHLESRVRGHGYKFLVDVYGKNIF